MNEPVEGWRYVIRFALAALTGGVMGAYLYYGRDYFWGFAVMSGAAVCALVYVTFNTVDRLRNLYRR